MSDDDRLTDYLARLDDADYRRTLADGCSCGQSLVACNAARYLYSRHCCNTCTGH